MGRARGRDDGGGCNVIPDVVPARGCDGPSHAWIALDGGPTPRRSNPAAPAAPTTSPDHDSRPPRLMGGDHASEQSRQAHAGAPGKVVHPGGERSTHSHREHSAVHTAANGAPRAPVWRARRPVGVCLGLLAVRGAVGACGLPRGTSQAARDALTSRPTSSLVSYRKFIGGRATRSRQMRSPTSPLHERRG